jgi:hypothetical protein
MNILKISKIGNILRKGESNGPRRAEIKQAIVIAVQFLL